jgi:hypothetical protein
MASMACLLVAVDDDTAACRRFFNRVVNGVLQALHFGFAWRDGVVHKHRNIKVTLLEGSRDVVQVHLNAEQRVGVGGIVGVNLDDAAVRFQQKVMRGGDLREAHAHLAAMV